METERADVVLATFLKKYGSLSSDGTYQISAAWETGLSNGAVVGEILGLMVAGILADHFGYRFTIGLALILVVCQQALVATPTPEDSLT